MPGLTVAQYFKKENMEQKFDFKFTQVEVNMILTALADRPFKEVQGLITQVVNDFNAQVPAAPAAAVTDVVAK